MVNKVIYRSLDNTDKDILGAEEYPVQIEYSGMVFCASGCMELNIDGIDYSLSACMMIVYFPNSLIHIKSKSSDFSGFVLDADFETVQPLLYKVSDINRLLLIRRKPVAVLTECQASSLKMYIRLYCEHIEKHKRFAGMSEEMHAIQISSLQTELLGNCLLLEIVSFYISIDADKVHVDRNEEVVQKFISMLYRHYKKEHEVAFYAERQFVTTRYFSTIIKNRSGKTPSWWIANALLAEAKRLLGNTNMSVKEISEYLNFPTQSYFGKWFKKHTGTGPSEFRR
ncbi:MAG: helix-turn-helix domain-containing protein [Bacteroides sp.]|nr:helix-turn-helix domain-containing protein [Roseburia sp.]MCM1347097.1 helix-turn-helix domain-containing protein [Bacteroides sp.]MCM1420722.1 helix-turn-helix domain-containing protein [Bacteroides sp.]